MRLFECANSLISVYVFKASWCGNCERLNLFIDKIAAGETIHCVLKIISSLVTNCIRENLHHGPSLNELSCDSCLKYRKYGCSKHVTQTVKRFILDFIHFRRHFPTCFNSLMRKLRKSPKTVINSKSFLERTDMFNRLIKESLSVYIRHWMTCV